MAWVRKWNLHAPGAMADRVGVDERSGSLLIADGWGVAFAALQVRRVEASSGQVLASVRTRAPVRAFGRAAAGDAVFFVGDKKLSLHDATTLERHAVYDRRVPRYSNAICDIGRGTVALEAPTALIEYDCATSVTRRLSKSRPVALGSVDQSPICLLADGTVMRRGAGWQVIGKLGRPQFVGFIDARAGVLLALAGERTSAYNENGVPQAVPWPRSCELTLASLRDPWNPREVTLPISAMMVGIVREMVFAVDAAPSWRTSVIGLALDALDRRGTISEIPGRFVAFAGPYGLVTSSPSAARDAHELSLFDL